MIINKCRVAYATKGAVLLINTWEIGWVCVCGGGGGGVQYL